jgi:hypothetical protein
VATQPQRVSSSAAGNFPSIVSMCCNFAEKGFVRKRRGKMWQGDQIGEFVKTSPKMLPKSYFV